MIINKFLYPNGGYTKLFQKDSLDATFCGGEANVAVSLANFGVQSEFLTVVPDNDIGHAIARTRAKTDIDLVSEPTKAQLAVILRRLEEQITQTLEVIER